MSEGLMMLSAFDVQRLESVLAGQLDQPEHVAELEARVYASDQAQPQAVPPDVVTMNSRVLLEAVATGKQFECTLVFPRHADPSARCISVLAPLGSAMFGARVGATLEVKTPAAVSRYRVRQLIFQPEAAGRYEL